MFTQLKDWSNIESIKDRIIEFKLGSRALNNIDNNGTLDFSCNSPYVAIILAYQMGCREIGVIGVDFTDNHCHMQDGTHELVRNGRLPEIERDYSRLHSALKCRKCNVYNLSEISNLTALPKIGIENFLKDEIHNT